MEGQRKNVLSTAGPERMKREQAASRQPKGKESCSLRVQLPRAGIYLDKTSEKGKEIDEIQVLRSDGGPKGIELGQDEGGLETQTNELCYSDQKEGVLSRT